jgi:hypothetical protein
MGLILSSTLFHKLVRQVGSDTERYPVSQALNAETKSKLVAAFGNFSFQNSNVALAA